MIFLLTYSFPSAAVCPNSCSGHGTCQSQKQFFVDAAEVETGTNLKYDGWDATKIFGCKCEDGFRGPDCSLRECPSGEDPQGGPSLEPFDSFGNGGNEYRDCSGRGLCDYSTGLCNCFKGFYGEDCSLQSALV